MEKKFGALSSTENPDQIANRVKGAILAASSVIIFLAGFFLHIQLNANDVIQIASELGAVAGAIWTVYGFILWVVASIAQKKPVPLIEPVPPSV